VRLESSSVRGGDTLTAMFNPSRRVSILRRGCAAWTVAMLVLVSLSSSWAQVLYDASLGTLPESQGWLYGGLGAGITKSMSGNSVLLDTSALTGNQAGWSRVAAPPLNRSQGFVLLFTAQVNTEAHSNSNRAGFSIIVLGSDTNGIELAFWTDRIFAQDGPPNLFVHAEDAAFTTTGGFVDYSLTLVGSNYNLRANGTPVLSGHVRDYTSFSGPINPYRTPNFLFFGDNTTSASASVNVRRLALVRPPLLGAPAPGVISWIGYSNLSYRVQASTNLTTWVERGVATSPTDTFAYTNPVNMAQEFLRVAHP